MRHIVNHELYEEIKIANGLILKIHKYSHIDNSYHDMYNFRENIIEVAPRIYKATKDIIAYKNISYPKGVFFIGGYAVEKCDKKDYRYEITGLIGNLNTKERMINNLKTIIEEIEKR